MEKELSLNEYQEKAMKPARCKNCAHHTWTIEGDAWCSKKICYTNDDGCCADYKRGRCTILWQLLAVSAPIIAVIVLIIMLLA